MSTLTPAERLRVLAAISPQVMLVMSPDEARAMARTLERAEDLHRSMRAAQECVRVAHENSLRRREAESRVIHRIFVPLMTLAAAASAYLALTAAASGLAGWLF